LEEGKEFRQAVVHGAAGIAKPALISTLSIGCAFASVTFLTDAPKFLFTPQALAVVFGMLASYVLSRTLVPILIDVLVINEKHGHDPDTQPPASSAASMPALSAVFRSSTGRMSACSIG
jgi:multidrug efflux pump subunit AcrB